MVIRPAAKKRKVIASDDEDLSNDEPAATASEVPKKATKKRSSKSQAKLKGKNASQAQETSGKKVFAVEPADDVGDDVVSDEEELAAASTTCDINANSEISLTFAPVLHSC
jgi:hypothetical protein